MSNDPSGPSTSPDSSQQRSWREIIAQALIREPKDREQLTGLLREAQQRNLLDADALAMIEGVLQVAEMQARDIMIPRPKMVVVNLGDTPEQILTIAIKSAHSRFPVIGENRDELIASKYRTREVIAELAKAVR